MMRFTSRSTILTLAAALMLGCGGDSWFRDSGDVADEVTAPESSTIAEAPALRGSAATDASPEIYHDLMRFDWYARGEPLMIDDRAYLPHGIPVSLGDREVKRAGEYRGVAFYTLARGALADRAVLVRVSETYWQKFAPATVVADSAESEESLTAE